MSSKEELIISEASGVFVDKRTKVKTVGIPFTFPDGVKGILSLTKLDQFSPWKPSKDLKKITIEFND